MEKIHILDRCRALTECKGRTPLTTYEYKKILELAIDCPLAGMPFDEVSYLYPLLIPTTPQARSLSTDSEVISISLRQNYTKFISVIGDMELKTNVMAHPDAILFAVGNIIKKIKGEKTYFNLRPRGWLIIVDPEYSKRQGRKKLRKKKTSKKE